MIILIHTSKTMRQQPDASVRVRTPELLAKTRQLVMQIKGLSAQEIETTMQVSPKLAAVTHELIAQWTDAPSEQREAVDSFLGDIYSGLQVHTWTNADRSYADKHLRILSGLYGILRPLDGIFPYRWEMGYKLRGKRMYDFWSDRIARTLPQRVPIVNLSAVEYSKTVTRYVDNSRIVTPKFLTMSPKSGEPTFVTVHAKIARGAFARWMIQHRIDDVSRLNEFSEIGYMFSRSLSSEQEPVFVCQEFGGLGLSVRLS